jgi:radical SAM protein with 4Fe4S-binding SPASM domain
VTEVQEAPFSIQMEPVQGCNLGCDFCGIHAIGYQRKGRGLDMMDVATAESVAQQAAALGWNPRIEFAMHGEPTLHPDLPGLIAPFRKYLPKSYLLVTSNGGGLLTDTIASVQALFDAGLNTLALDDYDTNKIVQRILRNIGDDVLFDVYDYPRTHPKASPHTRTTGHRVVIVEDLTTANAGTHSTLHNSAGDAGPLDFSKNAQRCAKPFREISVRWDGNVAVCCNDWSGTFKVGNVLSDGLDAVWQHPRMQAARRALYSGDRSLLVPCRGCNATTYRNGLLPDKKGKEALPAPDVDDLLTLAEATEGDPYTSRARPVLMAVPTVPKKEA